MSTDEVSRPLFLPAVSRVGYWSQWLFQLARTEILLPLAAEPAGDLLSSGEGR